MVFVGFVSLFPPVNHPGSALMIDPLLKGLNAGERKNAALKIALYVLGFGYAATQPRDCDGDGFAGDAGESGGSKKFVRT